MNMKNFPLKNVTYTRAFNSSRNHTIILGGESQWLKDIELLLEDEWKKIICPQDLVGFGLVLVEQNPRVCIVEFGAFEGNEQRMLESSGPAGMEKLLVTRKVQNEIQWMSTQRRMLSLGVKCLQLSEDSKMASEELSEALDGICSMGSGLSDDLEIIQNAHQGYKLLSNNEDHQFIKTFKLIASKFSFEPNEIVAGALLAETYNLWKEPKIANSNLYMSYMNVVSCIRDENILKLIDFSKQCSILFNEQGSIDSELYSQIATNSGFGRLTIRMLKGVHGEVSQCFSGETKGLRLVKAA